MTRTPIPNCPQPETPIRDRAWTDEQIEAAAKAIWNSRSHRALESAGFRTDWPGIARIQKAECREEARAALNATIGATP